METAATETPHGGQTSGNVKRNVTACQLLLLNAVVCGVEFCASAGFTYIPPMLLKAGLSERSMTFVMGLGPLLAFFVVPLLGRWSDQCQSKYGRRRPFIFGLSILVIISLILIPYGLQFGYAFLGYGTLGKKMGIFIVCIGVILLDFASEACLNPCEALLSDTCKNTNQCDRAFTFYAFMISFGGCVGYLITALDWKTSSVGMYFGGQEQSAFSLLIVLFALTLMATLLVAGEVPQGEISDANCDTKLYDKHDAALTNKENNKNGGFLNGNYIAVPKLENLDLSEDSLASNENENQPDTPRIIDCKKMTRISTRVAFLVKCQRLCTIIRTTIYNHLPKTVQTLVNVPAVLKPLAIANFCSWTAVMCFNLFYTDFVGQAVFGGNPDTEDNIVLRDLYDDGVRMASWGLFFHCILSAVYGGYFIQIIIHRFGSKMTYIFGNVIFVISMLGMLLTRNPATVNILASLTGFAYATVNTIPFTLVTMYHESREIYFYDVQSPTNLPRGTATDMAVLDSAFFLSQVLLSSFMGYVVELVGTQAYIMCSAAFGIFACYYIRDIIFNKQDLAKYTRRE